MAKSTFANLTTYHDKCSVEVGMVNSSILQLDVESKCDTHYADYDAIIRK